MHGRFLDKQGAVLKIPPNMTERRADSLARMGAILKFP